ncbi:Reverse transcriptase (RNA-dependent DNA polymerase) [Popillia japonica]|uniref:Reverse transcriptase (RNA-dependent DNA polymerase) n=1 Tax=Popillia japonica TaxID=7064 RepID=A0AAW1JDD1_POPJA
MPKSRGLNNWRDLRTALLDEFGERITNAQLHRMLGNRKMGKSETLQEYFLVKKELANRGGIEEAGIIQYIVDDYRKINRKIVKNRYPLQLIEDQLDRLLNAKVFSTLDLRNGFFHVDVEEASKKCTALVTHSGQYQFTKMSFGLCNSPAVFQRFINQILRNLTRDGIVLSYMDDLTILATDEREALQRLTTVLEVSSE